MSNPAPVPTEAAPSPVSLSPSPKIPGATIYANSWTPHRIVLRDTWFPLAHADSVRERPVRRAVYSHPYFLWREKGAAIAAEFHPHEKISRSGVERFFRAGETRRHGPISRGGAL